MSFAEVMTYFLLRDLDEIYEHDGYANFKVSKRFFNRFVIAMVIAQVLIAMQIANEVIFSDMYAKTFEYSDDNGHEYFHDCWLNASGIRALDILYSIFLICLIFRYLAYYSSGRLGRKKLSAQIVEKADKKNHLNLYYKNIWLMKHNFSWTIPRFFFVFLEIVIQGLYHYGTIMHNHLWLSILRIVWLSLYGVLDLCAWYYVKMVLTQEMAQFIVASNVQKPRRVSNTSGMVQGTINASYNDHDTTRGSTDIILANLSNQNEANLSG